MSYFYEIRGGGKAFFMSWVLINDRACLLIIAVILYLVPKNDDR